MDQFYQIKPLDSPSNDENELFIARYKNTDEKVVIKKCDTSRSQAQIELYLMTSLHHRHIICCHDIFEHNRFTYFVMEYAPLGNLYKKKFTDEQVKKIIYQVVSALRYCHNRNVIHRDIKPENIVMFENEIVKLIDFGWGCVYDENNPPHEKSGTTIYNAPEMLRGELYDYSVDIWQLGVLLFELMARRIPFEGKDEKKTREKILECNPRYPKHFSEELVDLLEQILTKDPADRISLEEITLHPWFYTSSPV